TGPIAPPSKLEKVGRPGAVDFYIVAHQDDDLLFLNPDVDQSIASGSTVFLVYLTAGDAGRGARYWTARERGARAAHARMAGVKDVWLPVRVPVAGRIVSIETLAERQSVHLVFLRLPDGRMKGEGSVAYGRVSLQKLWEGSIKRMSSVDGASSYTAEELL